MVNGVVASVVIDVRRGTWERRLDRLGDVLSQNGPERQTKKRNQS